MKFKLTSGDSTFSFEGELDEAVAIMDSYWDPRSKPVEMARNAQNTEDGKADPAKPKRKRAKLSPSGAAAKSTASISINAQELSNKIKISEYFGSVKTKVLDKKGDWVAKCKMVAFFSDEPITSGDVKRVMDSFKIKANLPTLSKALSSNSDQFLTSGDNPVKYDLTSSAEASFLEFLNLADDG